MLNSALAAVFMWTALFTNQGIVEDYINKFPTEYATMDECEVDAAQLKYAINSNEELVSRMIEDGFEGMVIMCTDDPDPFSTEE